MALKFCTTLVAEIFNSSFLTQIWASKWFNRERTPCLKDRWQKASVTRVIIHYKTSWEGLKKELSYYIILFTIFFTQCTRLCFNTCLSGRKIWIKLFLLCLELIALSWIWRNEKRKIKLPFLPSCRIYKIFLQVNGLLSYKINDSHVFTLNLQILKLKCFPWNWKKQLKCSNNHKIFTKLLY